MKKENKKILTVLSLSALVAGGAVICTQVVGNAMRVPAQNVENKIEFNKFDDSSSEEVTTATTTLKGNTKNFKHKGYSLSKTEGHWGLLAKDGYFKNVEPIRHLYKIAIEADAPEGVQIQIDYSKDGTNFSSKLTRKHTLTSDKINEIFFDGISDYFKLTVLSGDFEITSINLYFSNGVECDDTGADAWNYMYGGVNPEISTTQPNILSYGYYPQQYVGHEHHVEPGEEDERMPALRKIVADRTAAGDYQDGDYIWYDGHYYMREKCTVVSTEYQVDEYYYFLCLPVNWTKHVDSDKTYYECNQILDAHVFGNFVQTDEVDFRYSTLRKYVNFKSDESDSGIFQKTIFSFNNSASLKSVPLKDKDLNLYYSHVIVGSIDQYKSWHSTSEDRKKKCTDYAVFKGVEFIKSDNDYLGNYWSNTVTKTGGDIYYVKANGDAGDTIMSSQSSLFGISPVIIID